MANTSIERNRLDYLLTDIMPVEISELFTYSKFYEYLLSRQQELDSITKEALKQKSNNNGTLFCGDGIWATTPLKYCILKGTSSIREINLVQPLSALNMYLFVECYQKEILCYLKDNSVFSLRYHKKNNDLFYKNKVSKVTSYFEKTAKKINRAILQQTGAYFKIHKYNSISSFMNSRLWQMSNFHYKYFAKADYKSCFGSIYTHAFKWVIEQDVIDSKNANNTNLFIVIDRILQNINGYSSNGLIVGPEFSRMIAELLLQAIDTAVFQDLTKQHLLLSKDYRVFRYVDDLFIYSNSPETLDVILNSFETKARKYLLNLNDSKTYKCQTPVVLSTWLSDTRILSDRISSLFYNRHELHEKEGEKYLLKKGYISIDRLKDDFTRLVNKYPDDQRYIVSFILSTLLNHISLKKDGYTLFEKEHTSKAFVLLELAMYVLSYCPCFDHNQKTISILVYMDDELTDAADENKKKLQALVRRYSFIFERGNINDLCNWFVYLYEHNISLPRRSEEIIEEKLKIEDNPILWANYLIYSQYYKPFFTKVLAQIEETIQSKLNSLVEKEMMAQREFWYVIVFNNCPYLSPGIETLIREKVDMIKKPTPNNYYDRLRNLLYGFLNLKQSNSFFMWGYHKFNTSKQITYRTLKRTLFKQYKNKRNVELYGSLDS